MTHRYALSFTSVALLLALALTSWAFTPAIAAGPEGQLTWGVHITLAPTWFDPAETPGIITPYMVLLRAARRHGEADARAARGAEPRRVVVASPKDGLTYEFVLRKGVRFHNGDLVTAEDVKFSFERYRGAANKTLKERVAAVETPDPGRVRFRLKQPWPDFLTFYASATGAGWIVPKKYVEKVGDEGFKKAPIGAGPYKFVSFTPGVELVLEAFDQYWRKTPSVKRLVFRVIPDESTRLAALKRGEVDVVYSIRGALAEELQRTPGLTLKPAVIQVTLLALLRRPVGSRSRPWHDRRVRLAANLAIDRKAINDAETLGFSRLTGSIIPQHVRVLLAATRHPPTIRPRPSKLLAEAGYPNGFDAGEYFADAAYASVGEAIINYLQVVGIRVTLRPLERAAFFKSYAEKKLKNLVQGGSAAFGNAATRLEAFAVSGGIYAYGGYPDIDGLFQEQAAEMDKKRREATLEKIQQLVHDKVMYAPIWQLAFINGVGPRVAESGLGLIAGHAYSAPYEDVALKAK